MMARQIARYMDLVEKDRKNKKPAKKNKGRPYPRLVMPHILFKYGVMVRD